MPARINASFQIQFTGFQLNAELDLPAKGVTTLFGPSGSGKSTILRCIAGLERSDSGYLQVGDEVWQDEKQNIFLETHKRSLGYVFQEPRLFSHLTVKKNLEYGLKRTPISERIIDWDQVIALLAIEHLLERKPHHLSLGEQQRVAIGRALLASPKLLLMDEPLASLDIARKREVLPFIRKLHDEVDIPVVYVSHSLQEVLQITDNLVLVKEGKTVASGSLTELCSELELSQYLGDMSGSVLETIVAAHEDEFSLTRLAFEGGHLYVPQQSGEVGRSLRVHVLARNIGIALEKPPVTSMLNIIPATVVEVSISNIEKHAVQIKLDVGVPLLACISRKSLHVLRLKPGLPCYALIKAVSFAQEMVEV